LQSEIIIFETPLPFGSCGGNFLLTAMILFAIGLFLLDLILRRFKTRARLRYLIVGLALVLILLGSANLFLRPETVRVALDGAEVKIDSCNGLSRSNAKYARADLRFKYAIIPAAGRGTLPKHRLRVTSADGRDLAQIDLSSPRVDLEALRKVAPNVVKEFAAMR
jgi:hypothetical protein